MLLSEVGANASRDGFQECVTGRVPEGVVDRLEVIEVEAKQRYALAMATAARQRLLELLMEERPVREPGECIVPRHVGDAALGALAGRHVRIGAHGRLVAE